MAKLEEMAGCLRGLVDSHVEKTACHGCQPLNIALGGLKERARKLIEILNTDIDNITSGDVPNSTPDMLDSAEARAECVGNTALTMRQALIVCPGLQPDDSCGLSLEQRQIGFQVACEGH